jgi:hypothetical protein
VTLFSMDVKALLYTVQRACILSAEPFMAQKALICEPTNCVRGRKTNVF